MKKIEKKYKKGFTLVESLVAISILSLSILATFTAVQTGLKTSSIAKDQITAFYLAQEAVEYIKNVRDENALHSLNGTTVYWLSGLVQTSLGASGPCDFGKTCTIDSGSAVATNCSGGAGTCPKLNQNWKTGLYGYTTGSDWVTSRFSRELQFSNVTPTSADEVFVTITITWTSGATTKTFQVNQSLYNQI